MKAWFKSKTLKFNFAVLLGLLVMLFDLMAQLTPAAEYFFTTTGMSIYNGIALAGNIILRFITEQGIYIKPPEEIHKVGGTG